MVCSLRGRVARLYGIYYCLSGTGNNAKAAFTIFAPALHLLQVLEPRTSSIDCTSQEISWSYVPLLLVSLIYFIMELRVLASSLSNLIHSWSYVPLLLICLTLIFFITEIYALLLVCLSFSSSWSYVCLLLVCLSQLYALASSFSLSFTTNVEFVPFLKVFHLHLPQRGIMYPVF